MERRGGREISDLQDHRLAASPFGFSLPLRNAAGHHHVLRVGGADGKAVGVGPIVDGPDLVHLNTKLSTGNNKRD